MKTTEFSNKQRWILQLMILLLAMLGLLLLSGYLHSTPNTPNGASTPSEATLDMVVHVKDNIFRIDGQEYDIDSLYHMGVRSSVANMPSGHAHVFNSPWSELYLYPKSPSPVKQYTIDDLNGLSLACIVQPKPEEVDRFVLIILGKANYLYMYGYQYTAADGWEKIKEHTHCVHGLLHVCKYKEVSDGVFTFSNEIPKEFRDKLTTYLVEQKGVTQEEVAHYIDNELRLYEDKETFQFHIAYINKDTHTMLIINKKNNEKLKRHFGIGNNKAFGEEFWIISTLIFESISHN